MSSENEKRLERDIDRELKRLPDIPAPDTLAPRVMAAILRRTTVPWYRQSWQSWPQAWRVISLVVLLTAFGGLCAAAWQLAQTAGSTGAMRELGGFLSSMNVLWNTLNILLSAAVVVVKQLGTGIIIAGFVMIGLGYAICVGLSTVFVRLALAQR